MFIAKNRTSKNSQKEEEIDRLGVEKGHLLSTYRINIS